MKNRRFNLLDLVKLGLLLGIIGFIIFKFKDFKVTEGEKVDSSIVRGEIEKLVDLATVKYNYTNVVEYKNSKEFKGLEIPYTTKTFLLKYDGYIKGGIDFSTVDVKDQGKDLLVSLGPAKILDNVIEEEGVMIYNEREGIFNKLSFDDLYKVLNQEKSNMAKKALESGILKESEENAVEIIEGFLKGLGYKDINIIIKND